MTKLAFNCQAFLLRKKVFIDNNLKKYTTFEKYLKAIKDI